MLLLVMSLCQGCARYREIKIVSCDVESVSLNGLCGVTGVASVGIDNPAGALEISDVKGRVWLDDAELGTFEAAPVSIGKKSVGEYRVSGSFTLGSGVSLFQLLSLGRGMDLDRLTVDLSLKVKVKHGVAKRLSFEKVPASSFLGNISSGGDVDFSRFFM